MRCLPPFMRRCLHDELSRSIGLSRPLNLYAWIIAAVASYWILRYTQHRGWVVVLIGSMFVVMRMGWRFMPGYSDGKALDVEDDADVAGGVGRHRVL